MDVMAQDKLTQAEFEQLYIKALDENADAQFWLAQGYAKGFLPASANLELASYWFGEASKNGHREAVGALQEIGSIPLPLDMVFAAYQQLVCDVRRFSAHVLPLLAERHFAQIEILAKDVEPLYESRRGDRHMVHKTNGICRVLRFGPSN